MSDPPAKRRPARFSHIPIEHKVFKSVERSFNKSWRHPYPCPPIVSVHSITRPPRWDEYDEYCAKVKNEKATWHGTRRKCRLGEPNHTELCRSSHCPLCNIIRGSFDTSKSARTSEAYQRFGRGIYSSTTSSMGDYYSRNSHKSPYKVMLYNQVAVGKSFEPKEDMEHEDAPPPGYDSVAGLPGIHPGMEYDELVVYKNEAIRPAFLVLYSYPDYPPGQDPAHISIRLESQTFGTSWDRLTTMHLDGGLSLQQCYDVWKRCPRLEEFTAELASKWGTVNGDPVHLGQLRKVSFTMTSARACADLLCALVAPRLRDASLVITESFLEGDFSSLKSIPGIDNRLRKLSIQQKMRLRPCTLGELGQGLFSSLERLHLNFFEPNLDDMDFGPKSTYFGLVIETLINRHRYTEEQKRKPASGKTIVTLASVEVAYQRHHWNARMESQVTVARNVGVPLRVVWDARNLIAGGH